VSGSFDKEDKMEIRLLTNARVLGVLRSPGEGVITVTAAEGRRLIKEKLAKSAASPAPRKPAKKAAKPGSARSKKAAAPKATPKASPDPIPPAAPADKPAAS
jgi:topoisomerase IA-like protein